MLGKITFRLRRPVSAEHLVLMLWLLAAKSYWTDVIVCFLSLNVTQTIKRRLQEDHSTPCHRLHRVNLKCLLWFLPFIFSPHLLMSRLTDIRLHKCFFLTFSKLKNPLSHLLRFFYTSMDKKLILEMFEYHLRLKTANGKWHFAHRNIWMFDLKVDGTHRW